MQLLAHLNALKAFEAAARHLSFTKAASELGVTSAAVGLHVRTLEAYLGVKLFVRSRRQLMLSDEAAAVVEEVRQGLDKLSSAMRKLHEQAGKPLVTVSVPFAFGAKWLLPRLENFRIENPQLNLKLETVDRSVDLRAQNIDLGIQFGVRAIDGVRTTPLFDEWVIPVCTPALLEQFVALPFTEALDRATLIHDTATGEGGLSTWSAWLRKAGIARSRARVISVNSSILATQAALDGQGIALGRTVLIAEELRTGRLMPVFSNASIKSGRYWVSDRIDCEPSAHAAIFRTWLLSQAKIFQEIMTQSLELGQVQDGPASSSRSRRMQ